MSRATQELPRTFGALRSGSFSESKIANRTVKDELRGNFKRETELFVESQASAFTGAGQIWPEFAEYDCYACHQADYAGATNPDHQALGFSHDCATCHGFASWSGATFDHASTGFSLTGAHATLSCSTCHTGGALSSANTACVSCHLNDFNKTTNPNHVQSGFPTTCQTCHMQEGNHEVRTAWGFLAVRLPFPEDDAQWKADRITILQGLGVLDPKGTPTARLDVVKTADVARLTQEAFDRERSKMLATCNGCHSGNFAREQLRQSDGLIRDADHLMAEALRIVAALYQDGVLEKPKQYAFVFPDLLTFHDAPTVHQHQLGARCKGRQRGGPNDERCAQRDGPDRLHDGRRVLARG